MDQANQSAMGNRKSAMLLECVPNFSEGRKGETVERIARAIESVRGATVLNRHLDVDHNRSVITFAAPGAWLRRLAAVATAAG
jgi:glutamate formiminotransferase